MIKRHASIDSIDGTSPIVHISDLHGYYADAKSALTALGETAEYDPIVTSDDTGTLHWAGNDYVLVINGDVIDRGPDNEACLELVWRLLDEAPGGRVHYHIGNHEMAIFLPTQVSWPDTYSTGFSDSCRREYLQRIIDGEVTAAYEGYNFLYSHAGSNKPFDPQAVNTSLQEAAETLYEAVGGRYENRVQQRVANKYDRLFKLGENGGRGSSAGLLWLDFAHLERSAPPQIVGHTMRSRPVRKGNVICGNVLRMNHQSPCGEGILIETRQSITFVQRQRGGYATVKV